MRTIKTEEEVQKIINTGTTRSLKYTTYDENKLFYKKPIRSELNCLLFSDEPTMYLAKTNKIGEPDEYYIEKEEYNQLVLIFKSLKLPGELYDDMTWGYLNMVFASSRAFYQTVLSRNYRPHQLELINAIDLLEKISVGETTLAEISLVTKSVNKIKNKLGPETHTFRYNGVLSVFGRMFKNYKQDQEFERTNKIYYDNKRYRTADIFYGRKNMEKFKQDYYANTIYKYFEKINFGSNHNLSSSRSFTKRKNEVHYSKNRVYLLIGRMMILAGLMKEKKDFSDKYLIERIKKKVKVKDFDHILKLELKKILEK